ncbi:MAG: hypothetical protein ACJ8LN_01420 [Sulfurifustis sp.]
MPDLHHGWTDVFQRPGTVEWLWPFGEREHYWGYSFRPFQANEPAAEILRQWTSTDNDLRHTEHFLVSVADGNLYRLSAIWVVGT